MDAGRIRRSPRFSPATTVICHLVSWRRLFATARSAYPMVRGAHYTRRWAGIRSHVLGGDESDLRAQRGSGSAGKSNEVDPATSRKPRAPKEPHARRCAHHYGIRPEL